MAGSGQVPASPISTLRKVIASIAFGSVVLMYVGSFVDHTFHADVPLSLGLLAFATGMLVPELSNRLSK